MLLLGNKDQQ